MNDLLRQEARQEAAPPVPGKGLSPAELLLAAAFLLSFFGSFRVARLLSAALPVVALLVLLSAPRERLMHARVPVAVLLFLAWAGASYFWSADPSSSRRALLDLVILAAPAVAAGMLLDLDRVRRVATVCVKIVLAVSVLVLLVAPGWATAPNPGDPVPGWSATFSHKNGLGFFCLYAAVALFFDTSRARWGWLLATLVLLVGSQSSTALAVVVLVTGLLLWRRSTRAFLAAHQRSAYAILSTVALSVGVAALVLQPSLATRALGRDLSLTGRTEIWGPVRRQIGLHPEVGLGWGGVWRPSSPPTLEMWREARFEAFYAHNGYLDVMLQLGVVGALLFLVVLLGTLWRLWRMPTDAGSLWGVFLITVLAFAAITESAPFTDEAGLFSILLIATSVMQRTTERGRPGHASPAPQEIT